jgi:hypothetical protein
VVSPAVKTRPPTKTVSACVVRAPVIVMRETVEPRHRCGQWR